MRNQPDTALIAAIGTRFRTSRPTMRKGPGGRRLPSMRLCFALGVALGLGAAIALPRAQAQVTYNAALGTMPPAQGWTLNEDINPVKTYPVGLGPGGLYLSTLGFANGPEIGGGVWWSSNSTSIDFSSAFAVEVNVLIASSPDHAINPVAGWPRPGYALSVVDVVGRAFWVGLGSNEVFLSNTFYGSYGSPNTLTLGFNTGDAHHTYRIERAEGGAGAALRIDGVKRLELTEFGPSTFGTPLVYFGDPTYWANSESYTAWVQYAAGELVGVKSARPSGVLSARPLRCPSTALAVAFQAAASGRLTFEVFNPAGRRVARSEREVGAGGSGTMEVPEAHRSGLYYYRLKLVTWSGSESSASGRMVLLR